MYVLPATPLPIGGVIDNALRLFRYSFKRGWPLALAAAAIGSIYELAALANLPGYHLWSLFRADEIARITSVSGSPRFRGLQLLIFLAVLPLQGGLLAFQAAVARGDRSFTLRTALALGIRRFPTLLLASLLYVLAWLVGIVAFVIPGLYLFVALQLYEPLILVENMGPLKALRSSARLVSGGWWRASAILTVGAVIVLVFDVTLSLLGELLSGLIRAGTAERAVVIELLDLPATTVGYALGTAVLFAMYYDFRLRKEGLDLSARIETLGQV